MKKLISLTAGLTFAIVAFAQTENAQAFYYKESITKKMPQQVLQRATPRTGRFAINNDQPYVRTTAMYQPVQYKILSIDDKLLVKLPQRESSAAYGGGEVAYWPAWIGIPNWMAK